MYDILQSRLEDELRAVPKLKRYWRALKKKEKHADEMTRERACKDSMFIARLINLFMEILNTIPEKGIYIYIYMYVCMLLLQFYTLLKSSIISNNNCLRVYYCSAGACVLDHGYYYFMYMYTKKEECMIMVYYIQVLCLRML